MRIIGDRTNDLHNDSGGVFQAADNKSPLVNAWKNGNMLQVMPLVSRMYQIPIKRNDKFPGLTIKCMRVLTAVKRHAPDQLAAVSDGFFRMIHCENKDFQDDAQIFAKASSILGHEKAQRMMEASTTLDIKNELSHVTKEAVQEGAFGNPWVVATNSDGTTARFFGEDSFERLCYFLGKENLGPVPHQELQRRQSVGYAVRL
ncbi:hypothetical protein SeLEV6574_g05744 [Synchytrium endobioticum]|uniref:DSBA-like thioredoxin domain-containing protein n=1 Tax=Synchytrium endobioticum TaxID=286115 RepID=A0A507CSR7_9FUNG|nr:hypothetical protein SeLEV6574_g05744 [Synchytrium endobioticum]